MQACGNSAMAACRAYAASRPQGLSTGTIAAIALATVLVAVLVAGLTAALAWRRLSRGTPGLAQGKGEPLVGSGAYARQLGLVAPGEAGTV